MARPSKSIRDRLKRLERHLEEENPLLVSAVGGFRKLSRIGYSMGLLSTDESYATQIPWWPLISILGTFSAGKSTFVNHHLGYPLQDTGNQAVDDKFTVTCFGNDSEVRVLPGLALDADPRFPFYQTSEELEKVAPGEGRRLDAYLQLKTCKCDNLRGRIIIDSPGFDADAQRSATLRLTNHIIDLSDLVLVFFDARHPEPGAMSDTLAHLVRGTIDRSDSSKFLYILNQIDTTAREDNPEEVIGAWQRALAREGLTAGKFYCIYNEDAAVPIEDPAVRRRFEWKRDQDLSDINNRIGQVSVERSYRILGALENRAREIEETYVPQIRKLIERWRRSVLRVEGVTLLSIITVMIGIGLLKPGIYEPLLSLAARTVSTPAGTAIFVSVIGAIAFGTHFFIRHLTARRLLKKLKTELPVDESRRVLRAFRKNTRFWRSIFEIDPVGWTRRNRTRLHQLINDAANHVQVLNDRFTDPSGKNSAIKETDTPSDEKAPPVITGQVIPGPVNIP